MDDLPRAYEALRAVGVVVVPDHDVDDVDGGSEEDRQGCS